MRYKKAAEHVYKHEEAIQEADEKSEGQGI